MAGSGILLHEAFAGFNVTCHPQVAADYGAVAHGDAAQQGGVGVYGDVIAEDRMAGYTFDNVAAIVLGETAGTEGDTLIDAAMVTYHGSGSYHYARAVVNHEAVAYGSGGVDVDTGL